MSFMLGDNMIEYRWEREIWRNFAKLIIEYNPRWGDSNYFEFILYRIALYRVFEVIAIGFEGNRIVFSINFHIFSLPPLFLIIRFNLANSTSFDDTLFIRRIKTYCFGNKSSRKSKYIFALVLWSVIAWHFDFVSHFDEIGSRRLEWKISTIAVRFSFFRYRNYYLLSE